MGTNRLRAAGSLALLGGVTTDSSVTETGFMTRLLPARCCNLANGAAATWGFAALAKICICSLDICFVCMFTLYFYLGTFDKKMPIV